MNFTLPDDETTIGGKAIGVYGLLDIHGKPRNVSWTKLNLTAKAGSNSISLEQPVDWSINEEIVITTTGYDLEQTETFKITGISSDRRTLTLDGNLVNDHLVVQRNYASGSSFKIAAAVGLLSRNVKIIGGEYAQQDSDLYGI